MSNIPSKTVRERAQALAIHRMCGLQKGDHITISPAELPGAILFRCTKDKTVWMPIAQAMNENSEDWSRKDIYPYDSDERRKVSHEIVVSRYVVVSRDRFIVLDANGGAQGAMATVKSNHHLTEVQTVFFSFIYNLF
jgi:hypothetical protein